MRKFIPLIALFILFAVPFTVNAAWFNNSADYKFQDDVNYSMGLPLTDFPAPVNGSLGFACGASSPSLGYGLYPNVNGTAWLYCSNNSNAQLVNSAENARLPMETVSGEGINNGQVWDLNYMAVYSLQENTMPKDSSQYGNNLAEVGSAASNSSGEFGNSWSVPGFSTNTDYLYANDSPSLNLTGNVTLEAWIYIDAWSPINGGAFIDKGLNNYEIFETSNGGANPHKIGCRISDGLTWNTDVLTANTVLLGNWYYVACTWEENVGWKLYIDGQLDNVQAWDGVHNIPTSSSDLRLLGSGTELSASGSIDEVRISNVLRSPDYFAAVHASYEPGFSTLGEQQNKPPPPPTITITQPTGTIKNPFQMQFTGDGSLDSCWYSLDNGANVTIPNCDNITVSTTFGSHSLTIYANNTMGSTGFSTVSSFSVTLPNVTGAVAPIYALFPLLFGVLVILYGLYSTLEKANIKEVMMMFLIGAILIIIAFGIVAANL